VGRVFQAELWETQINREPGPTNDKLMTY